MEVEGIVLRSIDSQSGIEALRDLARQSATAWGEQRYSDVARLNARLFRHHPTVMSPTEVGRLLREAGCPISYVPYA